MATITISEFISIDGVVEAPGGEEFPYPGWSFSPDRGPEGEQYKLDETLNTQASLLGRRTYEGFAAAWPEMEGDFADHLNAMPKYVFSSTLKDPTWPNTTVLRGTVVGAMWAVRAQVAWIYLNSGLSKVSVSEWQEGSAIYYVARMEWFGASGPIGDLFLWATSIPAVALAISWGTIIGECAIAVFILMPGRWPAVAFAISAALHLAIIVAIGLFSFGWIMIGAVMSAAAPALSTFLPSSPPTVPTQTSHDELAESRTGV